MNRIRERIIEKINDLNDSNLFFLLEYAVRMNTIHEKKLIVKDYNNIEIKKRLSNISGTLAEDISNLRDDRV